MSTDKIVQEVTLATARRVTGNSDLAFHIAERNMPLEYFFEIYAPWKSFKDGNPRGRTAIVYDGKVMAVAKTDDGWEHCYSMETGSYFFELTSMRYREITVPVRLVRNILVFEKVLEFLEEIGVEHHVLDDEACYKIAEYEMMTRGITEL
jgi:hypothetical protein